MPGEVFRQSDREKRTEREIRRLRLRMEEFAAGGRIRATQIIGVFPSDNRPVEWYYNANLLGLGDELELHEDEGVWISASFAAGRAHYYIGAYCSPPCGGGGGISGTVGYYANGGWFCDALEMDLQEHTDVWISGECIGDRAVYHIGTYGAGNGGISGVDWRANSAYLGFGSGANFREDVGVWISGSFVGGEANYKIGAYPTDLSSYISGVDWNANGVFLGYGNATDLREDVGIWISGSFVGGVANYKIGAYATAGGISGVDWNANGTHLGFGTAVDLREDTSVWISGSFAGGVASFQFGAYQPDLTPYISGVDWEANSVHLGFGAGVDLREDTGVWISGSFVSGEANYKIGAYPTHARLHAMTDVLDHSAGNRKVFYSDGSGHVIELALGADGTFLQSEGPAVAPAFGVLVAGDIPNISATYIAHTAISPAEGFVRKTGAGVYTAHKSNLAAAVAPTANEDSGDGYSVGSVWIDTTADKAYVCLDASVGAAVWTETTQSGGGGGTKITHHFRWQSPEQTIDVNDIFLPTDICFGEAGEHGTLTLVRFKITADHTNASGDSTFKLYFDSAPDFSASEVEMASVTLGSAAKEGDDTSFATWVAADIFGKVKVTTDGGHEDVKADLAVTEVVW